MTSVMSRTKPIKRGIQGKGHIHFGEPVAGQFRRKKARGDV